MVKNKRGRDKTLKTCVNKNIAGAGSAGVKQCQYFTLFQGLHSLQADCTRESLERTLSLLIFFGIRGTEEFLVYKVTKTTIIKAQRHTWVAARGVQARAVCIPGRHLSAHIRSHSPDWRSCEEWTRWTVAWWSRSGPSPTPHTWRAGDCPAELYRRKNKGFSDEQWHCF